LSMRVLAMRDADMADMRARHAQLEAVKAERDTLLQALVGRLTEASRYLQRLEDPLPSQPAPEEVAQVLPAEAKPAVRSRRAPARKPAAKTSRTKRS
ncbi:MAG: hypothetical protein AB7E60_06120, partial [Sphingobium sp.]